jgi:hypothetical protein
MTTLCAAAIAAVLVSNALRLSQASPSSEILRHFNAVAPAKFLRSLAYFVLGERQQLAAGCR